MLISRTDRLLAQALLTFFVLLIIPGAQGSPFAGTPTSDPGRFVLVGLLSLVAFLIVFRPTSTVRWPWLLVLLVAALIKLGAATQGATYGWRGTYEIAESEPPTPARFIWQLGRHDYRIDRVVDFEGRHFGLHFLNDIRRYQSRFELEQRDVDLPLRIVWNGYFAGPAAQPVVLSVRGNGRFAISVDGRPLAEFTDPNSGTVTLPDRTTALPFSLQVAYDKPPKVVPVAALTVTSAGIALEPTPWPAQPVAETRRRAADAVTTASVVVGAAALLWLFVVAYWPKGGAVLETRTGGDWVLGLASVTACAAFGALAWFRARRFTGATFQLFAGTDPLFYESAANDIVHNGLLMPLGTTPGQGSAYYFYPLYSYVRAATQFLVGEDFAVAMLFNGLCVAAVPLLFWTLGWSRLPRWVGVAGVLFLGWFLYRHVVYFGDHGFTDLLFIFLVFVALGIVRLAVERPSGWSAFLAGVFSALAAACRPSFMTFVPVVVLASIVLPAMGAVTLRRRLVVIVIGFLAGLAPFTARNYVMTGRPVLLVESWIQIPYFLVPPEIPNPVTVKPGAGAPSLGESVAWAWSIIKEHPARTLRMEVRKVAFTLGLTNLGMPGNNRYHQWHLEFILLSVGFVVVMAMRLLPFPIAFTLGCFAVSHLGAMVLAAPWTSGYKSVLPLQLAFLFAVVAAVPAWRARGQ